MYCNYKNIFQRERLLQPDTIIEYNNIKQICQQVRKDNELKIFNTLTKDSFEIAKFLVQNKRTSYHGMKFCIDTITKKWLLLTNMAFPDDSYFLQTIQLYGITLDKCIDFCNHIEEFFSLIRGIKDPNDELEWIMIEHLDIKKLQQIKKHFQLNNMEVIVNKILEIAYLHPELLHTKEKS